MEKVSHGDRPLGTFRHNEQWSKAGGIVCKDCAMAVQTTRGIQRQHPTAVCSKLRSAVAWDGI